MQILTTNNQLHTKRKHFVNLFNYFAISKTLIPLSFGYILLFVELFLAKTFNYDQIIHRCFGRDVDTTKNEAHLTQNPLICA